MSGSAPGTGADMAPTGELTVLVVEDSVPVSELIRRSLEADGLQVDLVTNLGDARRRLEADPPDVVVLDVELPDGSGFELLREAGGAPAVPIVILSSRGDEIDKVLGLELGADDYVTKPFFPRELATRVRRAASRRTAGAEPSTRLRYGQLLVDLAAREVVLADQLVPLTDREFDLLAHMAASPRQVFHRDDLLRSVWRSSPEWQTPKTVTEHIRRLRQKIEVDVTQPRWIRTVGRAGYRFEPPDPDDHSEGGPGASRHRR